jgi:hypothetical protein
VERPQHRHQQQHQEVLQTLRLFGEQVIPHFQAKEQRTAVAQAST